MLLKLKSDNYNNSSKSKVLFSLEAKMSNF